MKPLTFQKGATAPVTYPLSLADVPEGSGLVNPCDGKAHDVPAPFPVGSPEHVEESNALVRLAMDVERNRWPAWYLEFCSVDTALSPILAKYGKLSERNPKGCANAVRMDQPGELWQAIASYSADAGLVPVTESTKGKRFLERYVLPLELFGQRVSERMKAAFEAKYFYGFPRPEEYFAAPNFSQYPEGCPAHPSYPAGHGTVGGAAYSCFVDIFPEAEQNHREAVRTATLQFAHFRDFARVHTRQDSREGWELGTRGV